MTINFQLYILIGIGLIEVTTFVITALLIIHNKNTLKRMMEYHGGFADVHSRFEKFLAEHHDVTIESMADVSNELMRAIKHINRWQGVIARMIQADRDALKVHTQEVTELHAMASRIIADLDKKVG